jgi:hypothetical protein
VSAARQSHTRARDRGTHARFVHGGRADAPHSSRSGNARTITRWPIVRPTSSTPRAAPPRRSSSRWAQMHRDRSGSRRNTCCATVAVRRGQPGSQLRVLGWQSGLGASLRACVAVCHELSSVCAGMLRARGHCGTFRIVWCLLLWRACAAAPCSCALVRDPCMGRWPRTHRDEHQRARTRARRCCSGARRSGRRRVSPLCCVTYRPNVFSASVYKSIWGRGPKLGCTNPFGAPPRSRAPRRPEGMVFDAVSGFRPTSLARLRCFAICKSNSNLVTIHTAP